MPTNKEVVSILVEIRVPFIKYDRELLNKRARKQIIESVRNTVKEISYIDIAVEHDGCVLINDCTQHISVKIIGVTNPIKYEKPNKS